MRRNEMRGKAVLIAVVAAGALTMAAATVTSAGQYYPTPGEQREYQKPCPTCPACPACPVAEQKEEDQTWFRVEAKGGVLMGVGSTSNRIDYGAMAEPTFGVKLTDNIDLELSYLWANNGVDNPGHRSGSMNMHCVRGGPRLEVPVFPHFDAYGSFKMGYCNTDGVRTGFSDDNFVVGPGGGFAVPITENFGLTAGTDLLWFTGGGRENTVITPNAGVRFKF